MLIYIIFSIFSLLFLLSYHSIGILKFVCQPFEYRIMSKGFSPNLVPSKLTLKISFF